MYLLKKIAHKYFQSFVYFYRYLRYRVFIVMSLSVLIGILDGLGLTMFLPLLQIADGQSKVDSDSMGSLSFIVDFFKITGIPLTLVVILILLLLFFSLKGVVTYFSNYYKIVVKQYFIKVLRFRLIDCLSNYSYKLFVNYNAGTIQNNLGSEVSKVSAGYVSYFSCIQNLIMVSVYMFFAFMVDWKFALLTTLGGMMTNLIYKSIYVKTKKESRLITVSNANFQSLLIQFVSNFKYLKATGTLTKYASKMKSGIEEIETKNKKMGVLDIRIASTREPLLVFIVCVVILIQVYVMKGSLGTVLVSLLFFYRALNSLLSVQANYNTFLGVSGSLENINLFEQNLKEGKEIEGKHPIKEFNKVITLQAVSFYYQPETQILKNVNVSVYKNQTVAFVGESGSGKTTIVNMISGLIKPNSGKMLVDGINIDEISIPSFQRRIGYIAQEPVIFNDTIYNNVTFWDEENPTNKLRFEKAIQQASMADFLAQLPEKQETKLGNNGINLSGGQKQRISIARELYKEIDILILDEATSALDSENEKIIQENIEKLQGNYTILIIAHRLSTIKNSDLIYLVNKGEINEKGSFVELLNSSERFKKMVELQEIS